MRPENNNNNNSSQNTNTATRNTSVMSNEYVVSLAMNERATTYNFAVIHQTKDYQYRFKVAIPKSCTLKFPANKKIYFEQQIGEGCVIDAPGGIVIINSNLIHTKINAGTIIITGTVDKANTIQASRNLDITGDVGKGSLCLGEEVFIDGDVEEACIKARMKIEITGSVAKSEIITNKRKELEESENNNNNNSKKSKVDLSKLDVYEEGYKKAILNLDVAIQEASFEKVLRDYQQERVLEFRDGLFQGKNKAIFEMATGTGKTPTYVFVLNAMTDETNKALIITPMKNIVKQLVNQIKIFTRFKTDAQIQTKVKKSHLNQGACVVIMTLKALIEQSKVVVDGKRVVKPELIQTFLGNFTNIVVEEAHEFLGPRGLLIINAIKDRIEPNQIRKKEGFMIGVTATTEYNLKHVAGGVINNVYNAFGLEEKEADKDESEKTNPITPFPLIKAVIKGVLAPIKTAIYTPINININFDDLNEDDCNEAIENSIHSPAFVQQIVDIYKTKGDPDDPSRIFWGQPFIIFAAGTYSADIFANELNKIPIHLETDRAIKAACDKYVANKIAAKLAKGKENINEEQISASFQIAGSLHSGLQTITAEGALKERILVKKKYQGSVLNDEQLEDLIANGKFTRKLTENQKDKIWNNFLLGNPLVMTGVDMLTTGLDKPDLVGEISVGCTYSLLKETQKIGRVTRCMDGKIGYTITVNYGIPSQQVFPFTVLDNQMRLGNFPPITRPITPQENVQQIAPILCWDEPTFLHGRMRAASAKKAAQNSDTQAAASRALKMEKIGKSLADLRELLVSTKKTLTSKKGIAPESEVVLENRKRRQTDQDLNNNNLPKRTRTNSSDNNTLELSDEVKTQFNQLIPEIDDMSLALSDILEALHDITGYDVELSDEEDQQPKKKRKKKEQQQADETSHEYACLPIGIVRKLRKLQHLKNQLKQLELGNKAGFIHNYNNEFEQEYEDSEQDNILEEMLTTITTLSNELHSQNLENLIKALQERKCESSVVTMPQEPITQTMAFDHAPQDAPVIIPHNDTEVEIISKDDLVLDASSDSFEAGQVNKLKAELEAILENTKTTALSTFYEKHIKEVREDTQSEFNKQATYTISEMNIKYEPLKKNYKALHKKHLQIFKGNHPKNNKHWHLVWHMEKEKDGLIYLKLQASMDNADYEYREIVNDGVLFSIKKFRISPILNKFHLSDSFLTTNDRGCVLIGPIKTNLSDALSRKLGVKPFIVKEGSIEGFNNNRLFVPITLPSVKNNETFDLLKRWQLNNSQTNTSFFNKPNQEQRAPELNSNFPTGQINLNNFQAQVTQAQPPQTFTVNSQTQQNVSNFLNQLMRKRQL